MLQVRVFTESARYYHVVHPATQYVFHLGQHSHHLPQGDLGPGHLLDIVPLAPTVECNMEVFLHHLLDYLNWEVWKE